MVPPLPPRSRRLFNLPNSAQPVSGICVHVAFFGGYAGLEGKPSKYETIIAYRGEWKWIVLPDKVVPYGPGVYLPLPGDRWDFLQCESHEEARKLSGAPGAGAPRLAPISRR